MTPNPGVLDITATISDMKIWTVSYQFLRNVCEIKFLSHQIIQIYSGKFLFT
jgi:hypothetical protein